jgi:hypothetical protein
MYNAEVQPSRLMSVYIIYFSTAHHLITLQLAIRIRSLRSSESRCDNGSYPRTMAKMEDAEAALAQDLLCW